MEFTLDEALQKGIEAHKAGNAQEADRYYTAILKVDPKHPDANHNMGVLGVGFGKVQEALPFFKTALEVNATIVQYWLSYIDALIRLERFADAEALVRQAKSKGLGGEGFDQIEKNLNERKKPTSLGDIKPQDPPTAQVQPLITLYSQGQFQEVLNEALQMLTIFPGSVTLYNLIGAANQSLGKLEKAIEAYNEVLVIKPDLAPVHYNIGIVLQKQGKLEKAIEAYSKAISL